MEGEHGSKSAPRLSLIFGPFSYKAPIFSGVLRFVEGCENSNIFLTERRFSGILDFVHSKRLDALEKVVLMVLGSGKFDSMEETDEG